MRGTVAKVVRKEGIVRYLNGTCPGRTALERTRATRGPGGLYCRIDQVRRDLVDEGLLTRMGSGNSGNPVRYWPAPE